MQTGSMHLHVPLVNLGKISSQNSTKNMNNNNIIENKRNYIQLKILFLEPNCKNEK